MGEALTLANAGEMLTDSTKAEVLDNFGGEFAQVPDAVLPRVVVASDSGFADDIVEQGIELCHEKCAMLDLLCISSGDTVPEQPLSQVLPRLEAETWLDFRVTRRRGELLAVADSYLRARRDTLVILLDVGESLRQRVECYRRSGRWFRDTARPVVKLAEGIMRV
jgi:hypothetical protein